MNTQNRNGCRRLVRRQLLAGLTLLLPVALYAQGPVKTNTARARQAADQLVAMTKPGYYTSRLVPDWRQRGQDQTQAIAVVAGMCERSRSTSTVAPSLHFTGDRLDAEQVQLVWNVRQAAVGVDFDIERSQQATSGFEPVLAVKSRGAVSDAETYQTIDAHRSTEFSYYRIKWVDLTGAQAYSPVLAVKGERPRFTVKAFPNPGSQKTMAFALTGSEPDKPLSMTIYDVQGRVLYQYSQAVPDSAHQLMLPNSVDFPAGLYYARIVDGQQAVSTPFIIQP